MKKHKQIRSSMIRDLQRGYPTEVDAINGVVCKTGNQVNIATPVNDRIVELVQEIEMGNRQSSWENIRHFSDL